MRYRFVAHVCILSILAAMPLSAQTINGCVDTNKGTLRIVKPGEPCENKEYAISWNSAGVNGTNGKDGINGVNGVNGLKHRLAVLLRLPHAVVKCVGIRD